MAIGTPAVVGTYTTGTSSASHVCTLSAGVAIGDHAILVAVVAGGRTLTGVVDSRGNTWQVDRTEANGSNHGVGIASAKITTALQSGDTVTFTWSSTGVSAAEIRGVSGLAATSWRDQVESRVRTTSSTTIGSDDLPGATDTADELVVAAYTHASNPTLTPEVLSPTWTIGTIRSSTGTIRSVRWGHRIVSATMQDGAEGTLSVAQVNSAAVVTYRAAAAAGAVLQAAPAAVSTLAGALTTAIKLAATVAAVSTLAGALSVPKPLQAAPAGVSGLSASLTATGPAGAALAATVGGSSTVAAALTSGIRLAAHPAGVSTVAAALTVPADQLVATIGTISTVAAALTTSLPAGIDNIVGLITLDYDGPALVAGEVYEWRGRVRDELGSWSVWSPFGAFTTGPGQGSPYDRWAQTILAELADPLALVRMGTLRPTGPDEVLPIAAAEAGDRWTLIHDHVTPPIDRTVRVLGLRARLFRASADQPASLELDAITEDIE